MSAHSRNKGKRGEREVAALIKDLTGWDVRRRVRQHDGDSDLEGVPGWCIEVKNQAELRLPEWWRQAIEQAAKDEARPVLFYKLPRKGWRALWPLGIALGFQPDGDWLGQHMTCDTTVEAWAVVAREAQ